MSNYCIFLSSLFFFNTFFDAFSLQVRELPLSITQSIFGRKKIKYKQNREWVAGGKLTYFTVWMDHETFS